ncbi:MAG TPA: isoprenylcysteine carboxylmethyltransferase family protein [Gemmatimonadaceae bacterium]
MTRDRLRRLRLPLGFVFGALYLAFARPTPRSLLFGVGIAFLGLLIRAWAAGHIVKNERLATTGPYAHTRNPLYFGSFLIAIGFALAAHWALVIAVVVLFLVIYRPTMEHERAKIRGRFPEAYAAWEANVPAFIPRLTPWRGGGSDTSDSFDFGLYLRHGEWKAAVGFAFAVAWLVFRTRQGL